MVAIIIINGLLLGVIIAVFRINPEKIREELSDNKEPDKT